MDAEQVSFSRSYRKWRSVVLAAALMFESVSTERTSLTGSAVFTRRPPLQIWAIQKGFRFSDGLFSAWSVLFSIMFLVVHLGFRLYFFPKSRAVLRQSKTSLKRYQRNAAWASLWFHIELFGLEVKAQKGYREFVGKKTKSRWDFLVAFLAEIILIGLQFKFHKNIPSKDLSLSMCC